MANVNVVFTVVEKHSRLLGKPGRNAQPGDVWDESSGLVHACNPNGRSHTLCGKFIRGERYGWFIGANSTDPFLLSCRSFLIRQE